MMEVVELIKINVLLLYIFLYLWVMLLFFSFCWKKLEFFFLVIVWCNDLKDMLNNIVIIWKIEVYIYCCFMKGDFLFCYVDKYLRW